MTLNQAIPVHSATIAETYHGVDVGLQSISVCLVWCGYLRLF